MSVDFYELLGVSSTATEDELKKAYRAKARQLHPDANPDDPQAEDKFKQVTAAYEVLRDPEKRRRYDTMGPDAFGPGASGGDPFAGFGGINDLFEMFFGGSNPFGGGSRRRPGPPPGADVEAQVELDLAEVITGVVSEVRLRLLVGCDSCSSTGATPGTTAVTCTQCGGSGEVRRVRQSLLGQMVSAGPCPTCNAAGTVVESPCTTCKGQGRRPEDRTYTVDVPAGVDTGTTLRLTGRGAAGARGGAPGDLYVHVRVRQHPRFERVGTDLVEHYELPFTQAALGAHIPYETLDGGVELVIPVGTQTGDIIRFRGKGVPPIGRSGRGDLLVACKVMTPTRLQKSEEDLLRQLAAARDEEVDPPEGGFLGKLKSAFR